MIGISVTSHSDCYAVKSEFKTNYVKGTFIVKFNQNDVSATFRIPLRNDSYIKKATVYISLTFSLIHISFKANTKSFGLFAVVKKYIRE